MNTNTIQKNMIQIIVGNIKNKRMQSYYHNNKSFLYILFHILFCTCMEWAKLLFVEPKRYNI